MGEPEAWRIPQMTFPFSVLLTRAGFPEKRSSAQGKMTMREYVYEAITG